VQLDHAAAHPETKKTTDALELYVTNISCNEWAFMRKEEWRHPCGGMI
jgi:hypothetical protein